MKTLKILLLALTLGTCLTLSLQAEKKPVIQKAVYVFGFSASFTDSVAFLTDVMRVDGAKLSSSGFLIDRPLYSLQLEDYVLSSCHVQNSTNAVFFSTSKSVLDKKYEKVNRMYQRSETLMLVYVGEDEFRFTPGKYDGTSEDEKEGGQK